MAWIESHTVLVRHRKVIGLARDLRLSAVHLVGHLTCLWHTVLEQQEDGDLSSWSDQTIAAAAHFNGDPARLVSLLQRHGLLDGRLVHDWLDYVGKYLKSKYSGGHRTADAKQRLVEIWKKHGREYKHEKGTDKQPLPSGSPGGSEVLPSGNPRGSEGHLTTPNPSSKTVSSSQTLDHDSARDTISPREKKPRKPSGPFVKPTVEDVAAYCAKRKNGIDAEKFVAHYESNGWMVGRTPMRSWKAAVITWEKNLPTYAVGQIAGRVNATQPQKPVARCLTDAEMEDPNVVYSPVAGLQRIA